MRNCIVQIPLLVILIFSFSGVVGCNPPAPRKGKIVGSSMSPTLKGTHYSISCPGCEIEFSCDLEQADQRETVVCPNCGTSAARNHWTPIAADPVSVLPNSQIQRWDVIAFERTPPAGITSNHELMTKRVVGLPGETIRFENGNIFANQVLISKPLQLQKQMRVLVCDSKFQSTPSLNWIFKPENKWKFANGIFQMNSPPTDGKFNWFGFRYQKNYFRTDDSPAPAAVEDFYGYNQSLSRKLNPMDEVFVELNTQLNDGILGWRFEVQNELYEFQIDAALSELQILGGKPDANPNTKLFEAGISPPLNPRKPTRIEFSSFDRVLRVLINGNELWTHPLGVSDSPSPKAKLSFGANSVGVKFERIRIWRDLYYFGDEAPNEPSNSTTPPGYFVIGDNVPLSHDSRHWEQPGVATENVKGKVIFK